MGNELHSKSLKELRVMYPLIKSTSKDGFISQIPSEGLGDTIEKALNNPVAKAIKKAIFKDGEDCGCDKRKAKLNQIFNYKRKALRCLDEEELNQYKKYVSRRKLNSWAQEDIQLLIDLYAKVFAIQYQRKDFCTNCAGSGQILLKMSNELDKVVASYE